MASRHVALTCCVVVLAGLTACATSGSPSRSPSPQLPTAAAHATKSQSLRRTTPAEILGSWRLVSGSIDGLAIAPQPDAPVTLIFHGEKTVNGDSGCNGFGLVDVAMEPGKIGASDLVTEHVGCGGAVGITEERYYDALLRAREFGLVDGHLHLFGRGVRLELEPAS